MIDVESNTVVLMNCQKLLSIGKVVFSHAMSTREEIQNGYALNRKSVHQKERHGGDDESRGTMESICYDRQSNGLFGVSKRGTGKGVQFGSRRKQRA